MQMPRWWMRIAYCRTAVREDRVSNATYCLGFYGDKHPVAFVGLNLAKKEKKKLV